MTVDSNRGLVRSGLSILSGCVLVLHNDDVLGWMFNPFSELVDVSVGVHGFDDGRSCNFDDFCALDNRFQGDANGFSAAGENAGGVDVAVNRGVVWNTVLPGDLVRAAPAEKFVFDGFAVGMAADVAPASVRPIAARGFGWEGRPGSGSPPASSCQSSFSPKAAARTASASPADFFFLSTVTSSWCAEKRPNRC
jgi:hypothetical protein